MTIFERHEDKIRVVCVKCRLNAATVHDDGSEEYWGRFQKIGWCSTFGSDRKFVCPLCMKHFTRAGGVPYRKTRRMMQGWISNHDDEAGLIHLDKLSACQRHNWPSIN